MRLSNLVVGVQVITMLALAVMFWSAGLHRLAIAQCCYGVATVVLFSA